MRLEEGERVIVVIRKHWLVFILTAAAYVSSLSLLGAATNIAFGIFGWQSPLLIPMG